LKISIQKKSFHTRGKLCFLVRLDWTFYKNTKNFDLWNDGGNDVWAPFWSFNFRGDSSRGCVGSCRSGVILAGVSSVWDRFGGGGLFWSFNFRGGFSIGGVLGDRSVRAGVFFDFRYRFFGGGGFWARVIRHDGPGLCPSSTYNAATIDVDDGFSCALGTTDLNGIMVGKNSSSLSMPS
jgi:hypothetical protein